LLTKIRCAHRAIGKSQSFLPLLTSSRCERTARTKDDNIITGAVDVASSCAVYSGYEKWWERCVYIFTIRFILRYKVNSRSDSFIIARVRCNSNSKSNNRRGRRKTFWYV